MDRRKELKAQYKQMKTEMGIFAIRSASPPFCYLETTQDLKGTMNKTIFQLRFGSHPQKELQRVWKELGENHLSVEVLEVLPYSKDETKTDYSEELQILKQLWEEKPADELYGRE
ncbi:GIY-YIG nuclease family protein [Anoxynatronum buryatiense]|nr:GIY-YIG nuclease family protein [Anoxynatronum buryatiense]